MIALIIGFAAVYATFSVVASWVQETVAGALQLRAANLVDGIKAMVADPKNAALAGELKNKLFAQPSIAATFNGDRLPSYLSSKQFSLAITGMLSTGPAITASLDQAFGQAVNGIGALDDSRLKDALSRIANQAAGDYKAFIAGVEKWYDDEMDRIGGWYRKRVQVILAIIGLALVTIFNIDSVALFSQLQTKPIVLDSSQLTPQNQELYVTTLVLQSIRLGWPDGTLCPASAAPPSATPPVPCVTLKTSGDWSHYLFFKVAGLLISAIAILLGAPFWFDTLKRFVNVRSAGTVPQKSDS